jgi:hypothetical protein
MEIVHNKINQPAAPAKKPGKVKPATWAQRASHKAYRKSLKDHAEDIAWIQQYWPGWLPKKFGE